MYKITDLLIKKHFEYAKQNTDEIKRFETIFDHMFYYFTSVLVLQESEAKKVIADFRSGKILSGIN